MADMEMELVAHGIKAPIRKETRTLNIKFQVDDANDIILKVADPLLSINEDDYSLDTLKTEYKKFTDAVADAEEQSELIDGFWATRSGAKIGDILEASVVTTVVVTEQIT